MSLLHRIRSELFQDDEIDSESSFSYSRSSSRRTTSKSLDAPPTAKPQVACGVAVWPEFWGTTRGQLRQLLRDLRADPKWDASKNLYDMVNDFIIPWTRGTGKGYALLLNEEDPKECTVMVSHAWAENAEDFIETLLRTVGICDVMFICALAIYQAADDAGPSIAEQLGEGPEEGPFRRVLEHIRLAGKEAGSLWRWRTYWKMSSLCTFIIGLACLLLPVCLHSCLLTKRLNDVICYEENLVLAPEDRQWLLYCTLAGMLLLVISLVKYCVIQREDIYQGRMIVVPNSEIDIYSRLWCVYEIFVARTICIPLEIAGTLAHAGEASSREARCGSAEDTRRIMSEIENMVSFEKLDRTVYITTAGAWLQTAKWSLIMSFVIAVIDVATCQCSRSQNLSFFDSVMFHEIALQTDRNLFVFAVTVFVSKLISFFAMFSLFSTWEGKPTKQAVFKRAIVMICIAMIFIALGIAALMSEFLETPDAISVVLIGSTITLYAGFMSTMALLVCDFKRLLQPFQSLGKILAVSFVTGVLLVMRAVLRNKHPFLLYPQLYGALLSTIGTFLLPALLLWHCSRSWGVTILPDSKSRADELDSDEISHCEDLETGASEAKTIQAKMTMTPTSRATSLQSPRSSSGAQVNTSQPSSMAGSLAEGATASLDRLPMC